MVEAANLSQLGVAAELAQERLDGGMLEHNSRQQRVPRRADRIGVAPPGAAFTLESPDNGLVGEVLEHELKAVEVG